jgi:hypothetical protein
MEEPVYGRFSIIASWPAAALFFAVFLICWIGFQLRAEELGPANKLPEAKPWYSPVYVRELFEQLQEHGRNVYAVTLVTLDLAFPLAYGGLFVALIGHVYGKRVARILVSIPLLAVMADLTENGLLAYYAWNFDGKLWPLLVGVATIATALKFLFFTLSTLLIAVGGLIALAAHPSE